MWYLLSENDPYTKHYLYSGEILSVSRQSGSHIYLPGDRSISRNHATITIARRNRKVDVLHGEDEIFIEDSSSKYGTFISTGNELNKRIPKDAKMQLKEGDIVRFGVQQEVFKLVSTPIIATSSQLKLSSQLKEDLLQLGGYLVKDYQPDCNYLVMSDILLTAKTVCALASSIPIVTPKYFTDMLKAVKGKQPLPATKDYLPPIKETILDKAKASFIPDDRRKVLFASKTFIFSSGKSFAKLGTIVKLAGGTPEVLSENNLELLKTPSGILVNGIEKKTGKDADLFNKATEILKISNLNSIPESDLGLAIVYVSTEKYCSPTFSVNRLLRRQARASQQSQSLQIFAGETEDMNGSFLKPSTSFSHNSRKVISETIGSVSRVSTKSCESTISRSNNLRMASDTVSLTDTYLSEATELFQTQSVTTLREDVSMESSKRSRELHEEETPTAKKSKKDVGEPDLLLPHKNKIAENILSEDFNPPFCSTENPMSERSPVKTPSLSCSTTVNQEAQRKEDSLRVNLQSFDSFNMDAVINNTTRNAKTGKESIGLGKRKRLASVSPVKTEAQRAHQELNERAEQKAFTTVKNMRKRAKGSDKEENVVQETPGTPAAQDEFYIPVRQSRHAKAVQKSQVSPVKVEPAEPVEMDTIEKSSPQKQTNQSVIVEPNQSFVPCKKEIKPERPEDDSVSKLGEQIEKSLVVVEVADLVISSSRNETRGSITSTSDLPNFKKFKKAVSQTDAPCLILPRILGGTDLVPHQEAHNIRDQFLASQSHLNDISGVSSAPPSQPTIIDHEFDLPMVRSRARVRAR